MRRLACHCALAVVLLAAVPAARAGEGAEVEGVIRDVLRGAKTPLERARRLLTAADAATDNAALRVALLKRAYLQAKDLYSPAGLAAAEGALDQLAQLQPDKKDQWLADKLAMYRPAFKRMTAKTAARRELGGKLVALLLRAGGQQEARGKWQAAAGLYREARFPAHTLNLFEREEVSERSDRATHFMRLGLQAASYERALKRTPTDAAARGKVIRAYLVDLDDPAAAAKFLAADVDEVTRTYVPLAAKAVDELSPAAARELGDWYAATLLPQASGPSRMLLLRRARGAYQRVRAGAEPGAARAKATLALAAVEAEIRKLTPPVWVNLLRNVDLGTGAGAAQWKPGPDGPRCYAPQSESTVLAVGAAPEGDYELHVEFIRHVWGKPDSVSIRCPVGPGRAVDVILGGYGQHLAGLENVRGASGSTVRDNGTGKPCVVTLERKHSAHVLVTLAKDTATILVRYNGVKLLEWTGALTSVLAPPGGVALGLGAGWNTSVSDPFARLRLVGPALGKTP